MICMRVYLTHSIYLEIFASAHSRLCLVVELIILFVHPVTATRTFITNKNYQHAIISPWPRTHPWAHSHFEWVFKISSEEVGPCRCCIFSHCISCSSVCIIRPTTLVAAAEKRCPYIYAHTFAPSYFKSFTVICLSAVRCSSSVLSSKILFVVLPFFITVFHAFFVRFC